MIEYTSVRHNNDTARARWARPRSQVEGKGKKREDQWKNGNRCSFSVKFIQMVRVLPSLDPGEITISLDFGAAVNRIIYDAYIAYMIACLHARQLEPRV